VLLALDCGTAGRGRHQAFHCASVVKRCLSNAPAPNVGSTQGFKEISEQSDGLELLVRWIALIAALLMLWVGVTVLAKTARAADCLAAPNSPSPPGSHWYYRLDLATQRKCWYVRALNQSDQQAATGATTGQASRLHSVPSAAKPKPPAGSAPLSVSPGATDSPSSPVEAFAAKPNDRSVSAVNTDEAAPSIAEAPARRQGAELSETNEQLVASVPETAHVSAKTNEIAKASPRELTPQASTSSRSESAQGTSVTAQAASQEDGPKDKAEVPMKPVILIVTFGLVVLGILSFAVPKLFKKETEKIQPSADVSEVAALIASKLARNRTDNGRYILS
jgi:hypothetical protein